MRVKWSVARRCFEATRDKFLASPELKEFLDDNGEWQGLTLVHFSSST